MWKHNTKFCLCLSTSKAIQATYGIRELCIDMIQKNIHTSYSVYTQFAFVLNKTYTTCLSLLYSHLCQ